MTIDGRGRSAAESLWAEAAATDVEQRLTALHRTHAVRTRRRHTVVGASLLAAAVGMGAAVARLPEDRTPDPVASAPPAATMYNVLVSDTAPSGRLEALAATRQDQPAVVVVRRPGTAEQQVVWSAETAQELVRANLSRPVAVAWAPDGKRLAFLVARRPYGRNASADDDLTLLTVAPDGAGRRQVPADLGPCTCTTDLPTLTWSADGDAIAIDVPLGTTTTHHDVTVPDLSPLRHLRHPHVRRTDMFRRTLTRSATTALTVLVVISSAGCGSAGGEKPHSGSTHTASSADLGNQAAGSSSPSGHVTEDVTMVRVGGHQLYATCAGTGSPTVVYIHGWVNDVGYTPHESAYGIRDLLVDHQRVCLYDRRNVGGSDTVDAVQTPAAMMRDLRGVLRGVHARPPYVLMAASFGGLLAYDFLNHHPDQVEAMVMIDTMFPDELALDRYLPDDATFLHYRKEDKCCTLERISQYELIRSLQQYIGHEPAVPMVYLASKQEPRNHNDYQSPEYDARILKAQAAFVDRFSPGELRWVDAPHFMEPVVPDQIAQAVRDVVALAGGQ